MAEPSKDGNVSGVSAANNGSTDNGHQQAGNADLLTNAFAGANSGEPAAKPDKRDTAKGDTGTGSGDNKNDLAPWANQLPQEMRDNPETAAKFAKYGKLGDMAKAFLELSAKAEGNAIGLIVPDKDATAEAVAEFWEKAGRPKSADGYSFAKDTESDGSAFAAAAFKANLTEAQGAVMLKNLQAIGEQKRQAYFDGMKQKISETTKALEKEYGNRYAEHMELLTRGLTAAGPNVGKLLADTGIAWELEIIKAFIAYGKMTSESGASRGGEAGDSVKSIYDGGTPIFKT